MKGQIEVYKDKDYAACPICGNAGKHREDCYVSRSLKAQTSGEYALLCEGWRDACKEDPPEGYVFAWGYYKWAKNPDGDLDELPRKVYFDGRDYWNDKSKCSRYLGVVVMWALKINPPAFA